VLRNRDYRNFWAGQTVSAIGSQFTVVAMGWHMLQLTDSALLVGLIGLCRAVPQMILAIFGGLLADAVDRKKLMMAVQLAEFLVSFGIAVLTFVGAITPEWLFVGALLFSVGNALEYPARQSIVPNLVEPSELAPAVALFNTTRSIGAIIGPAMAGVTLAVAGTGACYLIDALSWLVMFVAMLFVRRPVQNEVQVGAATLSGLLAGVRFVFTQPVILCFMILDFGATLFGQMTALLPIFARDILQSGEIGYGVLNASSFVGAVLAGLFLSSVRVDQAGKAVLVGVAVFAVCGVIFAYAGTLWLACLGLFGMGVGNAFSAVLRSTSNQLLTPDHLRGRVAAFNSIFTTGGPQLGQFRSGVVAEVADARVSAASGALAALGLVLVIALIPRVRSFRLSEATKAVEVSPAAAPAT
ncbi:MAG: MFS transporter, partial [Dehalococcoidia bacterium]